MKVLSCGAFFFCYHAVLALSSHWDIVLSDCLVVLPCCIALQYFSSVLSLRCCLAMSFSDLIDWISSKHVLRLQYPELLLFSLMFSPSLESLAQTGARSHWPSQTSGWGRQRWSTGGTWPPLTPPSPSGRSTEVPWSSASTRGSSSCRSSPQGGASACKRSRCKDKK